MAPPLASVPDLDRELDALYDLPLEEFTKARNDLVSRLRKAHQSEAATEVRALKKPTVVAWAANRLSRDEPKLTAALLEAGERLRDTQQRALAGNARQDEVADAAAAERDAIRGLLSAARRHFGLVRLAQPAHQVVARLGEFLERKVVERVQLAIEIGNGCERRRH